VQTVSFSSVLDALLLQAKTAEVSTSPKNFFVHVRVPEHVAADLREVQKKVIPDASKHSDIDHITLVYTKKPLEDHAPEKVHQGLAALREVGEKAEPIHAKIQGWGYFDGASSGGKTNTALVALLDAPGLEYLHVDMSRALKAVGIEPSDLHVFTPHITFGYLGDQGRVESELPKLEGRFTIDKAHVASRDHHEIPLTGVSMGQKAAREAMPEREVTRGTATETKEHHLDPDTTAKLVTDHLSKEPDYYEKESLGEKAARFAMGKHAVDHSPKSNFSMDNNALRTQHRSSPGKGEGSPGMGGVPAQTGAMHSGGGFR
jgi:2'-5' RNA ligase